MSTYRVGIDIGGTFTDAAFVDEQSGTVQIIKVPSTPADPSGGFMAAVERGLQLCDVGGEAVRLVVHATTVATNALIEGKTASLAMLTTQGFRDILEIGRQIRARLYDVHLTKELVNIRLTALGVSPKPRLPALPQGSSDPGEARKGQRPVWFSETGGFSAGPILDRACLRWGNVVPGPAVIEELDATTLVHPGYQAAVDQYGNLLVCRQ